jgi:hypothetical protein
LPLTYLSFHSCRQVQAPRNITKGMDVVRQMSLKAIGVDNNYSPEDFWKKL